MAEEKKPAAKKPAAKKPAAAKPAAEKKPAAKSVAAKPAAKPAAEKKPAASKPAAEKKPGAAKPTAKAEAPAAEKAPAKVEKSVRQGKSVKKKAAPKEKSPILKLHHLRPAPGSKQDRTRVGRGEASKGKTSGRGTKGTKARYQVRRGFKNPFRVEYQVVNLEKLQESYPQGGAVTVKDLVAKGLVRKDEPVKVLGNGDISVKLDVQVDKVSEQAKSKILAAGGSVSK
jgi:large subunit ribosomal protein L15